MKALALFWLSAASADAFATRTSPSFGSGVTADLPARSSSFCTVRRSSAGAAAAAAAAAPAGVLRMRASDDFDVNKALAELRQGAGSSAAPPSPASPKIQLPDLPALPDFPKMPSLPTPTQLADSLPKLQLPSLPELQPPAGMLGSTGGGGNGGGNNLLPPELTQRTGDTWMFSRLSEAASRASDSSVAAASRLLPPTPEKYAGLSAQAADAYARASLEASGALDALVAANPTLAPAVAHLRTSLADAAASAGEAYAAGNALVPEEYKPLAATLAIGAGATALGMAMAAASEEGREARDAKNKPLPREYDLPGEMRSWGGAGGEEGRRNRLFLPEMINPFVRPWFQRRPHVCVHIF